MRYREIFEDFNVHEGDPHSPEGKAFLRDHILKEIIRMTNANREPPRVWEIESVLGLNLEIGRRRAPEYKEAILAVLHDLQKEEIIRLDAPAPQQQARIWINHKNHRDPEINPHRETVVTTIIPQIRQHCGEIISVMKSTKKWLLRGAKRKFHYYEGKPQDARKPKDMLPEVQEMIDRWLTERGFKALRSNSFFVTGDFSQANKYGNVYVIFPRDGFDYTWFQGTKDLFNHLDDDMQNNTKYGSMEWASPSEDSSTDYQGMIDYLSHHMDRLMKEAQPRSDGIAEAIVQPREIMIANTTYWALNYNIFGDIIEDYLLGDQQ